MADKRKFDADNWDDDSSGTGSRSGGQSGHVEFHDFLNSNEQSRDDQLSAHDKRLKLGEHNGTHQGRVEAQKAKRDQYKDLKNGKIPLEAYRAQRSGEGRFAGYKANPILANAAQFSGKDPQVSTLPNEKVETNQKDQDELQLRLGQKLQLQNAPKFNPQLRPR